MTQNSTLQAATGAVGDSCDNCRNRDAIVAMLYESTRALDEERFDAWVAAFSAQGSYRIFVDSPELGQRLLWFSLDTSEMPSVIEGLRHHLRDSSTRRHLVTPNQVEMLSPEEAQLHSQLVVYRTTEYGESSLFAVATYEDRWILEGGSWRIRTRDVLLDTRLLEAGSHVPI